jgi:hypothetical protein
VTVDDMALGVEMSDPEHDDGRCCDCDVALGPGEERVCSDCNDARLFELGAAG